MSDDYALDGRVVAPPTGPVAGVTVQVLDVDLGADDHLAQATTAGDGTFSVTFTQADAGGSFEGDPEVRVRVIDDGEVVHEQQVGVSGSETSETFVLPSATADGGDGADTSMPYHGMVEHRGMMNVPRDPAHPGQGRFGRMFPELSSADHDVEFLKQLGLPGGFLDESETTPSTADNVPAGFVFFGQFIDHDITLDPLSSLARQSDPDALRNYRTPRLDLDNVYGAGPEVDRFLYQSPFASGTHTGDQEKLLLGLNDADKPNDLPRTRDDTAIIADMRNDENLILSQFQHVMLKFHNRIVDWLRAARDESESESEAVFEEAQQLARWHYQWIALEEFLPTVCEESVVEDVRENGRTYYTVDVGDSAYLPVEFAGAAYRYGHSQARRKYRINDEFGEGVLFARPGDDVKRLGRGFQPVPEQKVVDWRNLFDIDSDPQPARTIDPKLAPDLLDLPFISKDKPAFERSLASRNLVRGERLGLPSGQAVARRMGLDPLSNEDIGFDEALRRHDQPLDTETPLWYYVLGESQVETGGHQLGPVGSRIVAEVIVGLVESDPRSFLTIQPAWEPTLPAPHSDDGDFSAADLVSFALDY